MKKILCATMLASLFTFVGWADPVLVLDPSNGVISGAPGSIVGWGFTLTNTTDYAVITGSSFTPPSPLGVYQDFIGMNLIVAGPAPESTVVTQAFDNAAQTGVGAFQIFGFAPIGVSITGTLDVNYALYSRSPFDPSFNDIDDLLVADATLSSPVTIQVVPEPRAIWLALSLGAPLAFGVWRRRRR